MIDKLILVLVAIFVSVCAWLFWHNAQSDGFGIISFDYGFINEMDFSAGERILQF